MGSCPSVPPFNMLLVISEHCQWQGQNLLNWHVEILRFVCVMTYINRMAILGAFAILRKATIMSVRPLSSRMEQLGSHWRDFHEILYLWTYRKSVQKFPVSFKSNKKNR